MAGDRRAARRYGDAPASTWPAALTDAEQVRQRVEKQLRRRPRELGYELHKIETPTGPALE